jgi:hypothetical protein
MRLDEGHVGTQTENWGDAADSEDQLKKMRWVEKIKNILEIRNTSGK